jgi:hypothetical protein
MQQAGDACGVDAANSAGERAPLPPSLPLWAYVSVRSFRFVPSSTPNPCAISRHFLAPMPILLRLQSDLDSCKFRLQAHISSLGLSCLVRTRSSCPQRVLLSCKYAVKHPLCLIACTRRPTRTPGPRLSSEALHSRPSARTGQRCQVMS